MTKLPFTVSPEGIPEISPEETLKHSPDVVLIDVRRPDEFTGELGHAPGAQLVTLETDFRNWLQDAPKNKTYIFLCRSGARSGRATMVARSIGIQESYNMAGGMIAWKAAGLVTE